MLLKLMLLSKILSIIVVVFVAISSAAPNTQENGVDQYKYKQVDSLQKPVVCQTTSHYRNLSDLRFNPRSVRREDTACLVVRMFTEMGFIQHFNISLDTLYRFVLEVQNGYRQVPYHNWDHAFSVLHFSFTVLKSCRLIEKQYLTPLEGLSLLTAGMCHDIDHRGTNNDFQVEINNSLALKFKEQGSIMERHHIETTLALLDNSEINFLADLDEESWQKVKHIITEVILATDLTTYLKSTLGAEKVMVHTGFDRRSDRHRQLLRSVIISCADLSDQTRDWASVRAVAKLIYTEFFAQGDRERELGLSPNSMMDRKQARIPQQQIAFLTNVVVPDFQLLVSLCPETQVSMDSIQQNMVYWQRAVAYFEEQSSLKREQIDILSDCELDNVPRLAQEG